VFWAEEADRPVCKGSEADTGSTLLWLEGGVWQDVAAIGVSDEGGGWFRDPGKRGEGLGSDNGGREVGVEITVPVSGAFCVS
jgi:hypothetical protein